MDHNEYSQEIARHYAAYRPPLHQLILEQNFSRSNGFRAGLDIGSGAGHSAVALAEFCQSVVAIEPSPDMLKTSIFHERVKYVGFDGEMLAFADGLFDVITFGGSLFHAKTPNFIDEVFRVCQDHAILLVYDFEVALNPIRFKLGLGKASQSSYDHETDLSDFEGSELVKVNSVKDKTSINIETSDLGHLLLSDQLQNASLSSKYNESDPFDLLVKELTGCSTNDYFSIQGHLHSTLYDYRRKNR